jgi:two-component system chemotaxis response regulator CheY
MQLSIEQSKGRILIAEDDPVIRHLVCSIVKSEGYEVVVTEDGREAIKILQHDTDFKGAIFDMMMPHIKGIDIIRHMRTEKRFMRIPVMVITSEQDIHLVGQTYSAGAALFLLKPFSLTQLKSMLSLLVSQSSKSNVTSKLN